MNETMTEYLTELEKRSVEEAALESADKADDEDENDDDQDNNDGSKG